MKDRRVVRRVTVLAIALCILSVTAWAAPTIMERHWKSVRDREAIAKELAQKENALAEELRARFMEVGDWAVYPFWGKWRSRDLDLKDPLNKFLLDYCTSQGGFLEPGDSKPVPFLSRAGDKVAIAIRKADGSGVLILGQWNGEVWGRVNVIKK